MLGASILTLLFFIILDKTKQQRLIINGNDLEIPVVPLIAPTINPNMMINLINQNSEQPQIVTKETFVVNSERGPVQITKVSVKGGNFRGSDPSRPRQTPIEIISHMDNIIENYFAQAFERMRRAREAALNDNNNNNQNSEEKIEDIDLKLDDDDEKEKITNNKQKETNKGTNHQENQDKNDKVKETEQIEKKRIKSPESDKILPPKNKRKKQINKNRREIIFSKICKYVFYSIILFTFYVLFKKFFELLDVIDSTEQKKSMPEEEGQKMVEIKEIENTEKEKEKTK